MAAFIEIKEFAAVPTIRIESWLRRERTHFFTYPFCPDSGQVYVSRWLRILYGNWVELGFPNLPLV
jgi:hypothetical protein